MQRIKTCLYPRDAEEVGKIRLSERSPDDYIAWHFERSGIFFYKERVQARVTTGTGSAEAHGQQYCGRWKSCFV